MTQQPTHEVVDFGPGPVDQTLDYPFAGTEAECIAWIEANGLVRPDGESQHCIQEVIPDEEK
jgi:hypothetical protein